MAQARVCIEHIEATQEPALAVEHDLVNSGLPLNTYGTMKKRGSVKKQSSKVLYQLRPGSIKRKRSSAASHADSFVSPKSMSSMRTFLAKYDTALKRLAKR
jgi:hypothetical protein